MTTHTKQSMVVIALSLSFAFALTLPAAAQTVTASTNVNANVTATASASPTPAVQKSITKADNQISARLDALAKVTARIGDIKNLTDADKATLTAELQTQTNTMNALKTKIDADTDAATVKTDLDSITADYRIYALVIPQAQIIAAADRLKTVALDISIVAGKLQARITAAQSAGKDVTSLSASLSDIQTKLTDAQTQSQAAVSAVTSLVPDQGDTTKAAANTATLKQARADLKTGQADVVAARKDAGSILKGIQAFHLSATASASSTVTAQ